MKTKMRETLITYVGDNVGMDCTCEICEENRSIVWHEIEALLHSQVHAICERVEGMKLKHPVGEDYFVKGVGEVCSCEFDCFNQALSQAIERIKKEWVV